MSAIKSTPHHSSYNKEAQCCIRTRASLYFFEGSLYFCHIETFPDYKQESMEFFKKIFKH